MPIKQLCADASWTSLHQPRYEAGVVLCSLTWAYGKCLSHRKSGCYLYFDCQVNYCLAIAWNPYAITPLPAAELLLLGKMTNFFIFGNFKANSTQSLHQKQRHELTFIEGTELSPACPAVKGCPVAWLTQPILQGEVIVFQHSG